MKLHKLFLILTFMVFSTGSIFAQNNDMKARMEYEDAETAYQSQDYQKAVTHLESAEKLLGKPTAKTRYLLVLSLKKSLPVDYEYKDLEKLRTLTKHYVDNYTTDTEKYRDIYDLSNHLKNYPKTLAEYNKLKQQREEQIKFNAQKKEDAIKENRRNRDYILKVLKDFGFQPGKTFDELVMLLPEYEVYRKQYDKKYSQRSWQGPPYLQDRNEKYSYVHIGMGKENKTLEYFIDIKKYTEEGFLNLKQELYKNISSEYVISNSDNNKIDINIKNFDFGITIQENEKSYFFITHIPEKKLLKVRFSLGGFKDQLYSSHNGKKIN